MSGVRLVGFTALDLNAFLPLTQIALKRNVAASADQGNHDPPLHHLLCLAAIKNQNVKPTAESVKSYTPMFNACVMVACDVRDTAGVLECASMPSIVEQTVDRDIDLVFLSGSLSQWRDALLRGCAAEISQPIRHIYNLIYNEFNTIRLAPMFDMKTTPQQDSTFLLEHK